jgi:hypothetical protein
VSGGRACLADVAFITDEMVHLQHKNDGRECFTWHCREPDPKFPITWRCAVGHRTVIWYCVAHSLAMTVLAVTGDDGWPMCTECAPMADMWFAVETVIL